MKPGKGAERWLLLAEILLLAVALVLGILKKIGVSETETETARLQMTTENLWEESDTAQVQQPEENVEVEATETQAARGFSDEVEEKLAAMTLEEKVAQMFLTTPESLTQMEQVNIAGAGTRSAIGEYPVGGLIYSDLNFQGRGQMGNLMFNAEEIIHARVGVYMFLAARMDADAGANVVGISDNYEPDALVDVFAARRLDAESAGVTLPLHVPQQEAEISEDTAWVMLDAQPNAELTGDENLPCTLSGAYVRAIRETGYEGIVMTSSLSTEEIENKYSVEEAAVLAVQAGADLIYCPENFPDAYRAVLAAVQEGEIAEEELHQSVGRILTKKEQMPKPVSGADDAGDVTAGADNADDVAAGAE